MNGGTLLALSFAAACSVQGSEMLMTSHLLQGCRRWGPRVALLLLGLNIKGTKMLLGDLGSIFVCPLRVRPVAGFSPP